MFVKLLKSIFRPGTTAENLDDASLSALLKQAADMAACGDRHAAVHLFRRYLEYDPYNVEALNDLGACYASNGDSANARKTFELAYSLDDSSLPVMVNYANVLREDAKSEASLAILKQAKLCEPRFSQTDSEYARICFGHADMAAAKHFRLRGWLEEFDNIRHANGYLFLSSYCDIDEAELASEHLFWASTLRPVQDANGSAEVTLTTGPAKQEGPRKIRIGYWSPDLRDHAVRYFARPLIENHDTDRFEVSIFHDCVSSDAHTKAIQKCVTHFFDVHRLPDSELKALIISQQLDVLVELAGHTSYNRLPLLQSRLARLQITALGYPPTTGLATVDAKLMDTTIATAESSRYYTEMPLPLPTSMWCFDPMEDVPIASEPPVVTNHYITFGCVGNVAKITDAIILCWKEILVREPSARLLIRSVSFYDEANLRATEQRLVRLGLDESRLDFRKAEGGLDFFKSYDAIDIILDTFPFNGGTTSCFATYMGVPVISRTGNSLLSRMGLSILNNLDAAHLAVKDSAAYVERALQLANDVDYLRQFKSSARDKFQSTALGDGRVFTKEFECAIAESLESKSVGSLGYRHAVKALPASELISRAYAVLLGNQPDAARRILDHCFEHHPDHEDGHLLAAQLMVVEGRIEQAEAYLTSKLEGFTQPNQVSALIHAIRCALTRKDLARARALVNQVEALQADDPFDQLQIAIYRARCAPKAVERCRPAFAESRDLLHIHVLISAPDRMQFETVEARLRSCVIADTWTVIYEHCKEANRIAGYRAAMSHSAVDVMLLVTANITFHNKYILFEMVHSLRKFDVVGSAGAQRWERLDWRADAWSEKCGALLADVAEPGGAMELQWLGLGTDAVVGEMVVLSGALLAVSRRAMAFGDFDQELVGADQLLEEDWCYRAHLHGLKLAVNRRLGISVVPHGGPKSKYRAMGRLHLAEKMNFDAFKMVRDDFMVASAPVDSPIQALALIDALTMKSVEGE